MTIKNEKKLGLTITQWVGVLALAGGVFTGYTTIEKDIAVNKVEIQSAKDERKMDKRDIKDMRDELKGDIKVLKEENKAEHKELMQEIRRMTSAKNNGANKRIGILSDNR